MRTFGFSFSTNDLPSWAGRCASNSAREEAARAWGPEAAADRVSGPALDFCLLVAQRRHRDDLAISAVGDTARQSLTIAQAFAGAPGSGRAPIGS
ncbi:hypothetical protein [Saccharopolyspora pogona]|uniref:hypothetical protein n=1 Tax=Saccharopolyspora pogona TaxID=333966 RepID=UPI001CC2479D|nr:hypothetical protein [Saccharopolyspora pogona]